MNWRALLQNQWFQLCLLVALLSAGTMVYNAINQTAPPGGAGPDKTTPPARTHAPRKITAKKRGEWILDASGARDADGGDVAAVAASLTDGDVVTLRPGDYTGNCEIKASAHFIGPAPDQGVATIHCVEKRLGLDISGKRVSLENLSISFEVEGKGPAIRIGGDSSVAMTNCSATTKSKINVLLTEKASLHAQSSVFQAAGTGSCLKCDGTSRTTLSRCTFSNGEWGLELQGSAQVEAGDCVFQSLGLPDGHGSTIVVVGEAASATLETCQFIGNTVQILADKGGTLNITGSTFRENGVTGDSGNVSGGVICARDKGKVFLKKDNFYDNKQGLVAKKGGTLTMENVTMERTGLVTDNQELAGFSHAVIAYEDGTLTLTDCRIAESLQNGLYVGNGSHLKASKTTISDSGHSGLILGFVKTPAATGELDEVQILGALGSGVIASSGSQLTMKNCKVSDASIVGIQVQNASTYLNLIKTTVIGCSYTGVVATEGASLAATGCTIQENRGGVQAGVHNDSGKSGTITLTDCTIQKNTVSGIVAYQGSTVTMKGGYLHGNHTDTIQEGVVNIEP